MLISFTDSEKAELIIDQYYDPIVGKDNLLLGQHENSQYYSFVPTSGQEIDAIYMLPERAVATQGLGGEPITIASSSVANLSTTATVETAAEASSWNAYYLAGGGVLATAIGVLLGNSNKDNNTNYHFNGNSDKIGIGPGIKKPEDTDTSTDNKDPIDEDPIDTNPSEDNPNDPKIDKSHQVVVKDGIQFELENDSKDEIVFKLANLVKDKNFGGFQGVVITNFHVGNFNTDANADRIVLKNLLIGNITPKSPLSELEKYFKVEKYSGSTSINVDCDGDGSNFTTWSRHPHILLTQINVSLATLIENQQLVFDNTDTPNNDNPNNDNPNNDKPNNDKPNNDNPNNDNPNNDTPNNDNPNNDNPNNDNPNNDNPNNDNPNNDNPNNDNPNNDNPNNDKPNNDKPNNDNPPIINHSHELSSKSMGGLILENDSKNEIIFKLLPGEENVNFGSSIMSNFIYNFDIGDFNADDNADRVVLKNLLIGDITPQSPLSELEKYFKVSIDGHRSTIINIDRDGDGTLYSADTGINHISIMNQIVDLETLIKNQQLVFDNTDSPNNDNPPIINHSHELSSKSMGGLILENDSKNEIIFKLLPGEENVNFGSSIMSNFIYNFNIADFNADDNADRIVLKNLLIGNITPQSSLSELEKYFKVSNDGHGSTVINIDRDGDGTLYSADTGINHISIMNQTVDLATLIANQQLVF